MAAESIQPEDRNKLVYYDANIWVHAICGDDDFLHTACKPLFKDIEEGRVKAVTSYLVLSETLHTLRKKAVIDAPIAKTREYREKRVMEVTKKFTKMIETLEMQQKIQLVPTSTVTTSLQDHYRGIWEKMHSIPFNVKGIKSCPKCGKYLPWNNDRACKKCGPVNKPRMDFQYAGLGHPDLDHAYIALRHNVSRLYTLDRAFEYLWDIPEFAKMRIYVFSKYKYQWFHSHPERAPY